MTKATRKYFRDVGRILPLQQTRDQSDQEERKELARVNGRPVSRQVRGNIRLRPKNRVADKEHPSKAIPAHVRVRTNHKSRTE